MFDKAHMDKRNKKINKAQLEAVYEDITVTDEYNIPEAIKEDVEILFNDNLELVKSSNLYAKWCNLIPDRDDLEAELMIILYKASIAWYRNGVGNKIYTNKEGKETRVHFSWHFFMYVNGYLSRLHKQNKKYEQLKQNNMDRISGVS